MSGLKRNFEMKCMASIKNDTSRETYRQGLKKFEEYLDEKGISQRKAIRASNNGDVDFVQKYCDWLVDVKHYAPSTVHTYLTPITRSFGISLYDIDKPARVSSQTTKGRIAEKNPRGKADAQKEKYERIIRFASSVGIRRSEYAKLYGRDIVYNSEGKPVAVHVARGKGGKETMQHILPCYQDDVLSVVSGVAPDEKIFSNEEMRVSSDLHGYRRSVARTAYTYYSNLSPAEREEVKKQLIEIYRTTKKGVTPAKVEHFARQLEEKDYILRGANAEKARLEGRPLRYDRFALHCVSLCHLAHFRLDITVNSYLQ